MENIIKGTTSGGFAFSVPENRYDDMELLDALSDMDTNHSFEALKDASTLLLGKDQKKALYAHLRENEGGASVENFVKALREILAECDRAVQDKRVKNC